MAKKTNCTIGGKEYYKTCRVVGKRINDKGKWVPMKCYTKVVTGVANKMESILQRKEVLSVKESRGKP